MQEFFNKIRDFVITVLGAIAVSACVILFVNSYQSGTAFGQKDEPLEVDTLQPEYYGPLSLEQLRAHG